MCGVRIQLPEMTLLMQGRNTPVDKIHVFSLASILEDLVIAPLKLSWLGDNRVLNGFDELKDQIEKKEYEARLDPKISHPLRHTLSFSCVKQQTSGFFRTILRSVEMVEAGPQDVDFAFKK